MKKKIITAMGNQELNIKLQNYYNVISSDISYKEGIIELLEKETDIDILFLSELVVEIKELIDYIEIIKKLSKNIRIIIFLEKNDEEIKNILASKKVYDIYINNEIEFHELIEKIEKNNEDELIELHKQVERLKEQINNQETFVVTNWVSKLINKNKREKIINNFQEKKIVNIFGRYKLDSRIFAIIIAKALSIKYTKVEILEEKFFSLIEQIYKIKDTREKIVNLEKNIYLIKKETNKHVESKEQTKEKNVFIRVVDLNKNYFLIKEDINIESYNLFLLEPNLMEIKYIKQNRYYIELNKKKSNVNIVLYNNNRNSISEGIIKNIFGESRVICKINILEEKNRIINSKGKGKYTIFNNVNSIVSIIEDKNKKEKLKDKNKKMVKIKKKE